MHPTLNTAKLQQIPFLKRRLAMKALEHGRSLEDLQKVERLLKGASVPEQQLYLPVFMSCLDPADIPTSEELELLDVDLQVWTRIACSSVALRQFLSIGLSFETSQLKGFGPSTWPWVWPWTHFMHEHTEYLASRGIVLGDANLYSFFVAYASRSYVDDSPSMPSLIASSPGFRTIVGKAWIFMWHVEDAPDAFIPCLRYIARFLDALDYVDDAHFAEILEGAGGSFGELANLVTRYCAVLDDKKHTEVLGPPQAYLHHLIKFIQAGHRKDGPSPTPRLLSRRKKFMVALRKHGFVPTLVAAIGHLPPDEDARIVVQMALDLLAQLLNVPGGYRLLPAAIRAGMLEVMAHVPIKFGSCQYDLALLRLLEQVLGRGMVYYHAVEAVRDVLGAVKSLVHGDQFSKLEIFSPWAIFIEIAEKRVQLLGRLDGNVRLITCDNLQCGKVNERSQCRRCSGCRSAYYCDHDCQRADWILGGHRRHCDNHTTMFLADSPLCSLDYRERLFIRCLVQFDYEERVLSISNFRISQMAGGQTPVITFFDYNTVKGQVTVKSPADPLFVDFFEQDKWTHILTRTRKSGGRMQLHVVNIMDSDDVMHLVVPLRSTTLQVSENPAQY
ncbi:hypothetical protein R3P38DRAFT_3110594 [Favolaschia claudopus]|uniref:MYND-type domain-containing protein n=1 Tax=Favolaschia claudopus TaxID=2862362 RepID=A0AAV9ZID5_9AGAR